MKRAYLFGLVVLGLAGCANETEAKNISTPQSLTSLPVQTTLVDTTTETQAEDTTLEAVENLTDEEETLTASKSFESQQDFVDYMYEKVTALEETVTLLDSNLTQVYSVVGTDAETAQLSIRENLLNQTSNEMELIASLTLPNEEVATLQDYVVKAYQYNVDYKREEYNVFKAETLEERQVLLDENSTNEKLAQQYLTLAWSEIDRLSETSYDRK